MDLLYGMKILAADVFCFVTMHTFERKTDGQKCKSNIVQ